MKATNVVFAKDDKIFQEACKLAGIDPTTRQASKWRNGKGIARRFKGQVNTVNTVITPETPPNIPRI